MTSKQSNNKTECNLSNSGYSH